MIKLQPVAIILRVCVWGGGMGKGDIQDLYLFIYCLMDQDCRYSFALRNVYLLLRHVMSQIVFQLLF